MEETPRARLLRELTEIELRSSYSGVGRAGPHVGEPDLRSALDLGPNDLSLTGLAALDLGEHLEQEMPGLEIPKFWRDLGHRVKALHEFGFVLDVSVDLTDESPDLLRQHHCYWEAYGLMREQIIALLNGQLSLWAASLRPFLELVVAEAYFRVVGSDSPELRRWLDGKVSAPKWDRMTKTLGEDLNLAQAPRVLRRLHVAYAHACEYAHKPDAEASLLGARGTNRGYGNLETFFRVIMEEALLLQTAISVMLLAYPNATVPMDPVRKWGFNGPVGLFVGPFEVEAFRLALGDDDFTKLQDIALRDPSVLAMKRDWESRADLTAEQIEHTASEHPDTCGYDAERDCALEPEHRIAKWTAAHKAWLWALGMSLNYVVRGSGDDRVVDIHSATRLFD